MEPEDYRFNNQPLSMYDLTAYVEDGRIELQHINGMLTLLTPFQVRKTLTFVNNLLKENPPKDHV